MSQNRSIVAGATHASTKEPQGGSCRHSAGQRQLGRSYGTVHPPPVGGAARKQSSSAWNAVCASAVPRALHIAMHASSAQSPMQRRMSWQVALTVAPPVPPVAPPPPPVPPVPPPASFEPPLLEQANVNETNEIKSAAAIVVNVPRMPI